MIPMDALFWLMLAIVSTMAPRMRGVSDSESALAVDAAPKRGVETIGEESSGPALERQRVTP